MKIVNINMLQEAGVSIYGFTGYHTDRMWVTHKAKCSVLMVLDILKHQAASLKQHQTDLLQWCSW